MEIGDSKKKKAKLADYIVLKSIFSYLDLNDLRRCSQVCKTWNEFLDEGNSSFWRSHCERIVPNEAILSDYLSCVPSYKGKLRAYYHAWNPEDCSPNISILPNGFTLHRSPVAQSTDGARSKIGFRRGRHMWEILWEGSLGIEAVVGVGTEKASLQCYGYMELLGSDNQSWGWNLVTNYLLHNGSKHGRYPFLFNTIDYMEGERIRVILDCDDHTLSFEKDSEFLGIAFRGLPDKKLFPMISAVYANTEVSLIYLGKPMDD